MCKKFTLNTQDLSPSGRQVNLPVSRRNILTHYQSNIEIRHDFEHLFFFNPMTNIYQDTIEAVEHGSCFKVDFQSRNLKVDGKFIIKDGEYKGELGVDIPVNPLAEIERLYRQYRHSIPSERSERKVRNYFRALAEHELGDEDMLYGKHREATQAALELYILCAILQNKLQWEDFAKDKWFWQSPNEPSLIILKQWITNN